MSVNFLIGVIHIHPWLLVRTNTPETLPLECGAPFSWTVFYVGAPGCCSLLRVGTCGLGTSGAQMRYRDQGVLCSGQRWGVVGSWWIKPFKNGWFECIWGYSPAKGIRTNGNLARWVISFLNHMVMGCLRWSSGWWFFVSVWGDAG